MKLGFTGTRSGMTAEQREAFVALVKRLGPTHFSHGDCVNSDDQAATLVDDNVPGVHIVCHPPVDAKLRAYNKRYDEIREAKTYFARNRDIVDDNDALIATPKGMGRGSGGTWYTVNYAHERGKPVYIIYPDGSVHHEP